MSRTEASTKNARRDRARRIAALFVRPLLLVCGLLIAIGLGELILRVALSPVPQGYYPWPPGMEYVFHPRAGVLPGVSGPGVFRTNSWGLRGDAFSRRDAVRILAVGGSTTECLYLDETETWRHLLQAALTTPERPVWVGNAGRSGLGSREHILYAERLPPQYPKLDMMLFLVGGNDMLLQLNQGETFDPEWIDHPDWERNSSYRAFTLAPEITPHDMLQESGYGRLWWRIEQRHGRNVPADRLRATLDEEGQCYLDLRKRRADAARDDTLPDLEPGLTAYRRQIERIIDACEAQGVPAVFMTQPTMWRDDLSSEEESLLWFGYRYHSEEFYSARVLAAAMERYNETLLETCKARGVPCLDLANALPKDTTVFFDDMHFNEPGNRRVAQVVADYLRAVLP